MMNAAVTDPRLEWYRLLDNSRAQALTVLDRVTLTEIAYPALGWTVKDVLAHLTTWEVEVATSIHHFSHGTSYSILGFHSRAVYNQQMYLQYRDTPYQVVYSDWVAVRSGLKSAIRKTPVAYLGKQVIAPWEDLLTIAQLVESVVAHETEHMTVIQQATS
ncbi:MAG: DinB family protein [Anaerolineaceae bacterium]|nr:DinB family protein [Anaerolineaceae bacterium]